jgi:ribonuclease Z
MLQIVFLGTGSGIPTVERNHASIYFHHEGWHALFDCGEATQLQMLKAKINFMKINHIFISHWHADHWAGLIGLMQTMNLEKRRKPLYIHGPDAERFITDIMDLDYWGPKFNIIPKSLPFEGNEITLVHKTDEFEIFSIPVQHSVPAVAYAFRENDRVNVDIKKAEKLYGLKQGPFVGKLKEKGEIMFKGQKIKLDDVAIIKKGVKIVYSGDTEPCENLIKISENADALIHDATYVEQRENRMHSGAREAALTAKKANVEKLILTHFSRRYLNLKELEEEAKKVFPNTMVAKDFMKMDFRGKL